MYRTKFQVEIHKAGSLNDDIMRIIANHNEGTTAISLDHFIWLQKISFARFPTIYNNLMYIWEGDTIEMFENKSDSPTVTITRVEVHELVQEEAKELSSQ